MLAFGWLFGQNINAFSDYNNRLYKFENGIFQKIYYQPVKELVLGNNYVCYVDNKGDVIVSYYDDNTTIAQTYNSIQGSDNLLLVQTATVLRVFDNGVSHILTSSAMDFAFNDSLVVWQDQIGGYLKYYYKDEIHKIAMVVGDYKINSNHLGANTFVFIDNTGAYKILWHGEMYDMLSSNQMVYCKAGQDIVAFNDPNTQTFAVFDNGEFLDVEMQQAVGFIPGNGFVYYKDAANTHKVYHNQDIQELSFADITNINVSDSLIIFNDVGLTKVWYNDQVYQIVNNSINGYQVDGGIIAYKNNVGGVSAFVRGKEIDIENSRVEDFKLNGNTIMLKYSPSSYGVWWKGKVYRF